MKIRISDIEIGDEVKYRTRCGALREDHCGWAIGDTARVISFFNNKRDEILIHSAKHGFMVRTLSTCMPSLRVISGRRKEARKGQDTDEQSIGPSEVL